MSNVIRIKRRLSGNAGAPSSLKNAELAFNEVDQKLYYGKGDDGNGNATSVIAIGGDGWDASPDLSDYAEKDQDNTYVENKTNTFNGTLNVGGTFQLSGSAVTATAAELNVLDGVTSTTAELNILDGVTATTAELNILDGVTATASELNLVDGAVAGTVVNGVAVVYGAAGEVDMTSLEIGGVAVTATPAELNVLDGITSSTAELNILDGVTADKDEINLLDGALANTVVNSKAVVYGASGEVAASSVSTTGAVTVGTDLTVSGNLTVNGTTVTVNAETVEVEDKNIVLGKVETPTDATADGGGITLKGSTDKTFNWVDADDAWTSSEHVKLAAGKDLIMAGATSGAVTVVVPDVAGTSTVTLPAETGTVLLDTTVCAAIASCTLDGGSF